MMLFDSHCKTRHSKYASKCFHIFLLTPNFLKTPKNDRKNGIVIFENVLAFNQISKKQRKEEKFSQNESQKDDCIRQLDSKEYRATYAFERLKNAKSEVVCVFLFTCTCLHANYGLPKYYFRKLISSD